MKIEGDDFRIFGLRKASFRVSLENFTDLFFEDLILLIKLIYNGALLLVKLFFAVGGRHTFTFEEWRLLSFRLLLLNCFQDHHQLSIL